MIVHIQEHSDTSASKQEDIDSSSFCQEKKKLSMLEISRVSSSLHLKDSLSEQIERILSSEIHVPQFQTPRSIKESQSNSQQQQENFEELMAGKCSQILQIHATLQSEVDNINELIQINSDLERKCENLATENQRVKKHNQQLQSSNLKLMRKGQYFQELIVDLKRKVEDTQKEIRDFRQNQIKVMVKAEWQKWEMQLKQLTQKARVQMQSSLKSGVFLKFHYQTFSFSYTSQQKMGTSKSCQTTLAAEELFELEQQRHNLNKIHQYNRMLNEKIEQLEEQLHSTMKNKQKTISTINLSSTSKVLEHCLKPLTALRPVPSVNSASETKTNKKSAVLKALIEKPTDILSQLQEINFVGQIRKGLKVGQGVSKYQGHFEYRGCFKKDKRHGLGSLFFDGELLYRGEWKSDLFDGKGTLFFLETVDQFKNVQKIEGYFQKGLIDQRYVQTMKEPNCTIGHFQSKKKKGRSSSLSLFSQKQKGKFVGRIIDEYFLSECRQKFKIL